MRTIYVCLMATLILAACSEKEKSGAETETKKENTIPDVPVVKTGFKIGWYSVDSLNKGYKRFKEVEKQQRARQKSFESQLEAKQKSLEQYVLTNEDRAKSGQLSENQIMMVQQEVQTRQSALYQFQQTEGAKLEKDITDQLTILDNRVQAAGKKYCEKHGIDLLLAHGKGGQINYIQPSMDVTKEFVAYLNEYQEEIDRDLGQGKKKK